MKNKYILFTILVALFLGMIACQDDKSVYLPEPQWQKESGEDDEDDGVVAEPTTDARIKVLLSKENRRQVIDGFGCAFAGWADRLYANTAREDVLDRLFGKDGLNLSFHRGKINESFGNSGAIDFGWDRVFDLPADHPSIIQNFWSETADREERGQLWLFSHMKKKHPDVKTYYSTWSPPKIWKSAGNVVGGSLKKENYQDFAEYMVDFVEGIHKTTGVYPYAISPTNEPNTGGTSWAGCRWLEKDLADFVVDYLRPALNKRNHQDVAIVVGEHAWWNTGGTYVDNVLKARPEIVNCNIIASGHGYFSYDGTKLNPYTGAVNAGLKVWNTETSDTSNYDGSWKDGMKWATLFHYYFTKVNLNAFIWWAGARPVQNNESLIRLEEELPGTFYHKPEPMRFYTFGQFSKHIPANSERVEIEMIVEGNGSNSTLDQLLVSAYVHEESKKFVVVIVNNSGAELSELIIDLENLGIKNMQKHESNETHQWIKTKVNPSKTTATRYVKISPNSVITITGTMASVE